MPVFDVGLDGDLKIRGVGEFGYHSYLLFAKGETFTPSDKNLQAFAAWRSTMGPAVPLSHYLSQELTAGTGQEVETTETLAVASFTNYEPEEQSPTRAIKAEPASPPRQQKAGKTKEAETSTLSPLRRAPAAESGITESSKPASDSEPAPRSSPRRSKISPLQAAQETAPTRASGKKDSRLQRSKRQLPSDDGERDTNSTAASQPKKVATRAEETPSRQGQRTLTHFFSTKVQKE